MFLRNCSNLLSRVSKQKFWNSQKILNYQKTLDFQVFFEKKTESLFAKKATEF